MIGHRTPRVVVAEEPDALRILSALAPGVVLIDIEHTLAAGNGPSGLEARLASVARAVRAGGHTPLFVSNASIDAPSVTVVESAHKPFTRRSTVRRLVGDRPVVAVWGDQVLTDGLLARRLGVVFLQQHQHAPGLPARLAATVGGLLTPLLFVARREA
jgi:predicted HAD superfamily phosphohydrolase YqeG